MGRQVKALVWKNLLIASRNPRDLFRELGIPVLLLGIMALLSRAVQTLSGDATIEHTPLATPDVLFVMSILANTVGAEQDRMELYVAPCEQDFYTNGSTRFGPGLEVVGQLAAHLSEISYIPVRCFLCEGAPGTGCSAESGAGVSLM